MMRRAIYLFLALGCVGLMLFLAGCPKSYEGVLWDEALNKGLTEDEALTALFESYKYLLFKVNEDGSWQVDYSKWPIGYVEQMTADLLSGLDYLLSYKSKAWSKLIDALPGLRAYLEREEVKWRWVHQRVRHVRLHDYFVELMGTSGKSSSTSASSSSWESSWGSGAEAQGHQITENGDYETPDRALIRSGTGVKRKKVYSSSGESCYTLSLLWPKTDLHKLYPFVADYVARAREEGTLRDVSHFLVLDYGQFGKAEVEPSTGRSYWEARVRGLDIVSYMVREDEEIPETNQVQYVEIYRVEFEVQPDGTYTILSRESKPALKGFMSKYSNQIDVLVIDTDREGDWGWGTPDVITRVSGVREGRDLYLYPRWRSDVLDKLFQKALDRASEREKLRPKPTLPVEIVYRKGFRFDVWEACPESGCVVPYDYKSHDWDAKIIFVEGTESEELKQIEWFVKEYSSVRKVIEYYEPLPEFAGRDIREAIGYSNYWKVRRAGQPTVEGDLELFAISTPKMIDYTDPGNPKKTWRLMDEDGDGIFEKRRALISS